MFFLNPSKEIEIATNEITTTFLIVERFDALLSLMTLFLCVYKKSCLSLSWLVAWSVSLSRKCLKSLKTSDPGVAPYSCNLPTFIHIHPLSFTFIHFHSPSFTFIHFHSLSSFIHSCKCSLKMFIHQRRSFTHS